ncbi:MAG: DJ-1/PfpI family protein [bacterium]|nr:DJ-1/PfpI family protein [bacterium]
MKRILMIVGDFTEDYEVMVPFQALEMLEIQVDVVCPGKKKGDTILTAIHDFEGYQTYTEKVGHHFTLTASYEYLDLSEYDGLYLTGGRAPEYLRREKRVLDITKYFMELNLPVAAICHGIQILTAAGVIEGRTLTAYDAVGPEVTCAGGNYKRVEACDVVVDDNLVTSPAWPGHSNLLRAFIKLLGVTIIEVS